MNITRRTRLIRTLGSAAVLAAMTAPVAMTSAAAAVPDGAVVASFVGEGAGYADAVPDAQNKYWPARAFVLKVGDKQVETFCIQFNNREVEKSADGVYQAKSWAASGVKNLAKAADIAARHDEIGTKTPGKDENWETAAAQAAIWHLTDGVEYTKIPDAAFVARVKSLIDGAKDTKETPSSYVLTASAGVEGSAGSAKNVVSGKLATVSGAPISGKVLKFTVDGTKLEATTGSDGVASVSLPAGTVERTASVLFEGTLAAGSVLAPDSGKQIMVTAAAVPLTRTADVKLVAGPKQQQDEPPVVVPEPEPQPEPEATPPPTPAPTPAPEPLQEKAPDKLPYTGGSATIWMLLAAAGTSVGGFLGWRKWAR